MKKITKDKLLALNNRYTQEAKDAENCHPLDHEAQPLALGKLEAFGEVMKIWNQDIKEEIEYEKSQTKKTIETSR